MLLAVSVANRNIPPTPFIKKVKDKFDLKTEQKSVFNKLYQK